MSVVPSGGGASVFWLPSVLTLVFPQAQTVLTRSSPLSSPGVQRIKDAIVAAASGRAHQASFMPSA